MGQMDKEVYTTSEAARICRISPSTLFRAIRNNQIKAFATPGGHYRITREDLDRFLVQSGMPSLRSAQKRSKVLVVEDNPTELRLIRRLLERDPLLDVRSTDSGFEAGYLMKAYLPDLILLDVFLKDMDGRDVIRLIRSDPDLQSTPILVITGARDTKEITDLRKHDIQDLILKPLDTKTFLSSVKAALKA
jgi:excisionase family DNA binding protein